MTRSRARFACLLWLLLGSAAVCAQTVLEQLEACLAQMERTAPELDADPLRLGQQCPALAERLAEGRWSESFQPSPHELDTALLRPLLRLLETYERGVAGGPVLSTEPLTAIVEELAPFEVPPSPSAWERVVEWLDGWLGAEGLGVGWLDWLRDVTLPERWERAVVSSVAAVLVLGGLVVMLAAVIAAVHGRGGVRRHDRPRDTPAPRPRRADLERLPPAMQPIVLLEMIVERMRRRSAARFRDSLTHRELVAAAGDLEPNQRRAMEAVANAAERVTFGAWRPMAHEVEAIVREGRALLEALSADGPGPREGTARVAS